MKHFDFSCELEEGDHYARFYTTGDPDRDAAIVRECIRLDTPIEIPPLDVSFEYADDLMNAERKRLHALVP